MDAAENATCQVRDRSAGGIRFPGKTARSIRPAGSAWFNADSPERIADGGIPIGISPLWEFLPV
jgi:hypothetical protein